MKIIYTVILFFFAYALSAQTLDYMGWIERSASHIEQNRLDSAAVALQKAMALEPANEKNPVLLLTLGKLQRQLGHYDDAYISFTACMANDPSPALALHNRASLLCDMERFDEAMEDYNTLIRDYPEDVEAYYRRGILFLERNDRSKAETDFKASELIDPDNMYTKLSKALLYKLDDNWAAAEQVYTGLIQSSTSVDPSFYMNRAECYVNSDQMFKASADLRAVEGSQKENPYFYILRGRVRLAQFDKVAARADFRKAKELGYDADITDGWLKKTEKK
ncbi:tetratricopeptide repeat protein [Proteiniphilum sp.]|uniref:tetratricopeptide repeat protein n=1 Tax=Proteiniphilum sp. TaxID=1926877 RepID=UPI002B207500|nr:tetratricopeptide repeat protein [Proteiniphilum sp.]MEA4918686.1 tetratricopeptide repeat protein [Proteiniphilum sp.]